MTPADFCRWLAAACDRSEATATATGVTATLAVQVPKRLTGDRAAIAPGRPALTGAVVQHGDGRETPSVVLVHCTDARAWLARYGGDT